MSEQPQRGRPWPADSERATETIVLRVTPSRRAAYRAAARAANAGSGETLAAFMFRACDAAAGFDPEKTP